MSEAAWFDRFALGGIIALAMLLIAAVVYAVSSRKRGNTVVIVGPSDSGKTLLFELLVSGKHVSTHTSMVANEHTGVLFIEKTVSPSPGPVNLVDFPGQKRVRGQLQAFLDKAVGVVLTIDASNPDESIREGSDMLFDLLTNPAVRKNGAPILICCNKSDIGKAVEPAALEKLMLKEMEQLRKTRAQSIKSLDGTSSAASIGVDGKAFEFDHVKGNRIRVARTSSQDPQPVIQFIRELVR